MRKLLFVLTLTLVFSLSQIAWALLVHTTHFKEGAEPDGFRGIKWGQKPKNKYGLVEVLWLHQPFVIQGNKMSAILTGYKPGNQVMLLGRAKGWQDSELGQEIKRYAPHLLFHLTGEKPSPLGGIALA